MRSPWAGPACFLMVSASWAQGGFSGPGRYEIANVKSGKVLDLDRSYALDAGGARNSERFDPGKDGNVLIVSELGPAVDIPDGSGRDGVHAQVYDANGNSNQRFAFRPVNSGRRGDWDRGRDGYDGGGLSSGGGGVITCTSNKGGRAYCETDTRGGNVQLMRQISGTPCRQGQTWGWNRRGIWVDRGCRAEFAIGSGR